MLAIVGAGFTSAMVLGVPLGVIISKYTGWRGALIFVAILGAVASLCMWGAGVPEPDSTKRAPSLSEQLSILGRPETLIVLTPFLIWSIANFGLYTFIAAILGRQGSSTTVPYLLLLFGLGCMAGNFIGGSLSDRYGPRRPTIFCLGMLICDLAAIQPASSSIAAAAVTMIGWGVCMAALFTLQQQRAIAVNPQRSNLILALNNSALYLGASIGAAAGGLVISSMSVAVLSPTSAAVAFLGLVALLLLPRPRASDTPGPPNASIVMQRGTGADFALLPPESTAGNFVKPVQRVPVPIGLNGPRELLQSISPARRFDLTHSRLNDTGRSNLFFSHLWISINLRSNS
jgi:predicted MFS family arabinose efflux permease